MCVNTNYCMSIDPKEWEKRSVKGELCGIIACNNSPTVQCSQCSTHYCDEHKNIHKHPLG
jgi:hypothetical protein